MGPAAHLAAGKHLGGRSKSRRLLPPTSLGILAFAPDRVSPRRGGRVWLNATVSKALHRI